MTTRADFPCCGGTDEFPLAHCQDCCLSPRYVELRDRSFFVRGTNVLVRRLWQWHERGVTVETLLKRYPTLGPAKVLGALAFAHDNQALVNAELTHERRSEINGPWLEAAARDAQARDKIHPEGSFQAGNPSRARTKKNAKDR